MNEDRHAAGSAAHADSAAAAPTTSPAPTPEATPKPSIAPDAHEAHPAPVAPSPASVISPNGSQAPNQYANQTLRDTVRPPVPTTPPPSVAPAAAATATPVTTPAPAPAPAKPAEQSSGFYRPETPKAAPASSPPAVSSDAINPADLYEDDDQPDEDALEWVSDDTPHEAPGIRPIFLIGGVILLTGLVYLLTRDLVSTLAVGFAATALLFYNNRRPRQVHYRLDRRGITIDHRAYAFSQFRSFAYEDDTHTGILTLAPLQRFMPLLTISYKHEMHDDIIDKLAEYLPMEARHGDGVDRMMRRFRF